MRTRPNVLWITCDELRASSVGCYGDPLARTPHADRLAAQGVRFGQCHVQMPKCIPQRPMMLTGRYAHAGGARTMSRGDFSGPNFFRLTRRDPSLLTWLAAEGYALGLAGKNHVLDGPDAAEMFERVDPPRPAVPPTFDDPGKLMGRAYFAGRVSEGYDPDDYTDAVECDRAVEFLRRRSPAVGGDGRPFCFLLDIGEPHPPYKEWPGLMDDVPLDAVPLPPVPPLDRVPPVLRAWRESHGVEGLTDDDRRRIARAYASQVAFADRLLGRVLRAVDDLGLAGDTLVVWGSDHGDFAGDFGCYEKWDTALYDCITRVPLVLRLPGRLPAGRTVESLTELIDVAPTILELLGLPVPDSVHGQSLLPVIHDPSVVHKEAVFSQGGVEPAAVARPGLDYRGKLARPYWGKQRTLIEHPDAVLRAHMVRTATHKLIHRLSGDHELYDLVGRPARARQPDRRPVARRRAGRPRVAAARPARPPPARRPADRRAVGVTPPAPAVERRGGHVAKRETRRRRSASSPLPPPSSPGVGGAK